MSLKYEPASVSTTPNIPRIEVYSVTYDSGSVPEETSSLLVITHSNLKPTLKPDACTRSQTLSEGVAALGAAKIFGL